MTRKLLLLSVVVMCGFVQRFECSRVKFEQGFEPIYRHDHHQMQEPLCKREHFYPREPLPPPEPILPQQTVMRAEPIYEPIVVQAPQQPVIHNEQFIPNDQLDPFIRRDAYIRREPIRRESFLRTEPLIRSGRIYQNAPAFREGGIFRDEPNAYAIMMSPCPCPEAPTGGPNGPQDFYQIPQPIQPIQQQPIVAHRLIFSKPLLKTQGYQPVIAFPRFQRYVRKGFKPITENVPFAAPSVQAPPVQDFAAFGNQPMPFSGNFQAQGQQQESTSEPSPVTPRNVPQVPNPLSLAQMSSIC